MVLRIGIASSIIFAMVSGLILPETRLVNIEAVGTYGLTPQWEDGHHYGIYNWNYLRKLCPCPDCREEEI